MNILMIQADQMTAGVLGAAGHPVARTPRLDALAAGGTLFESCYCNAPLCVPSRASMITGRLPEAIDSFDNGSELPATRPTLMHLLRAGGHRTALAGKMHFIGPDQLHGAHERLTCDIYPAGVDWTPDWRQAEQRSAGRSARKLDRSGPADSPTIEMRYDEMVADAALKHMETLAGDGRPFFLWVSFTHPHDPFAAGRAFWDIYRDDEIPPPAAPPDEPAHPYNRWINVCHDLDRITPDARTVQRSRRGYYAMASYVDHLVGQLLDRLDALRLADDTLVLFLSDHGEMLGEHGMWFKRTFWEESVRVPLIVRVPGDAGGRRESGVVSLVDLLPTLCELAGVRVPDEVAADMDGDSFAALVRGQAAPGWKDQAVGEYLGEGALAPMRFIRRGPMKLVDVVGQPTLLFDLSADPHEQRNLLADGAAPPAEAADMQRRMWEGVDRSGLAERIMRDQQRRLAILEAVGDETTRLWDFPPAHFLAGR
ncbi:MAG: Choline-sulfatase [Phycisphaerae bacterium]|nr:Choline-sulfatase [Phycisphaerae bacterium]